MVIWKVNYRMFYGHTILPFSQQREETPYRLTYGIKEVIPVEIEELAWRKANPISKESNGPNLIEEKYLLEEKRMSIVFTNAVIFSCGCHFLMRILLCSYFFILNLSL